MATQLLPLRAGTRQRRAKVGSVAYAAASTLSPVILPRVGLLNRLIVQFRGTVTLSGAGALADLGPWNLVARFALNANIGSAAIINVSGFGAYLISSLAEDMGFRPDLAGVGAGVVANADIFAAPVAMGANTWVLTWVLPVAANNGKQFGLGLINLQSPETQVDLTISTGALLDPATLVTATTGTFHIYYEYYEIPDPRRFALPPLALVKWYEDQQPVTATGENIYTVPRQGVLLQLFHRLSLNGPRSDSWDSLGLRFNKTDNPYVMERQWERTLQRMWYALNPLVGVMVHDLWHAESDVSCGDTRDAVDTEELSTLESVVTVSAGAVLGANNNFLASIRRIVQILE